MFFAKVKGIRVLIGFCRFEWPETEILPIYKMSVLLIRQNLAISEHCISDLDTKKLRTKPELYDLSFWKL
jgi:hypothetical protein